MDTLCQDKTTCEIYSELQPYRYRTSVQSALFSYIHHGIRNPININLKYRLNSFARALISLGNSNKYVYSSEKKCDILFRYYNNSKNYIGTQTLLSKSLSKNNISTGIISESTLDRFNDFHGVYKLSMGSFISKALINALNEECSELSKKIREYQYNLDQEMVFQYLLHIVWRIEEEANIIQQLIERVKPSLFILTNEKDPIDTAAFIASKKSSIKTLFIPHGFPQRSQSPIKSDYIGSYSPYHDGYLSELGKNGAKVIPLGWLEPSLMSEKMLEELIERNSQDKQKRKHINVLFLSQISGWNMHKCYSLVKHVPNLLKALDKNSTINSVTVRLRPNERKDPVIHSLFEACNLKKLRLSEASSIEKDLSICDMLVGFSSTGLLYAPYLGLRGIEIRDRTVNSVWGENLLPDDHVYYIDKEFDENDFNEFINNTVNLLNAEKYFYHYRKERNFSDLLSILRK
jgi:hypothetical protein